MESKSRNELIALCKERAIRGYSGKKKAELIELLEAAAVAAAPTAPIKNVSPLRYPGGKTRAIKVLDEYIGRYYAGRKKLISPFFGGGSYELHWVSRFAATTSRQATAVQATVQANDLFNPLYTFWTTLKADPAELIKKIRENMPVNKETFKMLRESIMGTQDIYEKAAAYFIINRTSFSGATLCGGFSQQAADGRLTESSLDRLNDCKLDSITFSNKDCCAFLKDYPETADTVVYADPPYYIETYIYGKDGDMHENFDHDAFAAEIKKRSDWIICYNDCKYIRDLYEGCQIFEVSWAYGMNAKKKSSEILILPPAAA